MCGARMLLAIALTVNTVCDFNLMSDNSDILSMLQKGILRPMIGISVMYTAPNKFSLDIYFPDRVQLIRNLKSLSISFGLILMCICSYFGLDEEFIKYGLLVFSAVGIVMIDTPSSRQQNKLNKSFH